MSKNVNDNQKSESQSNTIKDDLVNDIFRLLNNSELTLGIDHIHLNKLIEAVVIYITNRDHKVLDQGMKLGEIEAINKHSTRVYVALNKKQMTIKELMTGKEWYDRFERELANYDRVGLEIGSGEIDFIGIPIILEAAKKASGIE